MDSYNENHVFVLNGSWEARGAGAAIALSASVPGTIHADLLSAGLLEDPFFRDNESKAQWVSDETWHYTRCFEVSEELFAKERCVLRFDGLDTLATILINGAKVGETDNQYRVWEFEAKEFLRLGSNRIEVIFHPVIPYLQKKVDAYAAHGRAVFTWGSAPWEIEYPRGILRKMPSNFGWDWGPVLITCGIHRPVSLIGYDHARIKRIHVDQWHSANMAELFVSTQLEQENMSKLIASTTLFFGEQVITVAKSPLVGGRSAQRLLVDNPKLWWPAGLGDQPLYRLVCEVRSEDGALLDKTEKRIGLRQIELVREPDEHGESFFFKVNGVPLFAKGANWIPADAIYTRPKAAEYKRLILDCVAANMNMLRVWGGGQYEPDFFYDLCDAHGILVWQEFMFACQHIPLFDKEFVDNCKVEAEEQVSRLHHHACLCLWCGNNEFEMGGVSDSDPKVMQWREYMPFFDKLLADAVKNVIPSLAYWPSSPHTPGPKRNDFNNAEHGDTHYWAVWHGQQPFEWYRLPENTPRFCSEFGFQSFPHPKTIESYTGEDDRNITTAVMEHHQRSGIGNTTIMRYMLDWFRLPVGFENTVWASQLLQGLAIQYAVEHWRRNSSKCMGALYWQLNDSWPVASWASIDYFGRWKALHYFAKRFFAPFMVSLVENASKGAMAIYATNDTPQMLACSGSWAVTTAKGEVLKQGEWRAEIGQLSSVVVASVDCAELIKTHGANNLLVWASGLSDAKQESRSFGSFAKPKHLLLSASPEVRASVTLGADPNSYLVTVSAAHPALWAWIDLGGDYFRCSDNFFSLRPGENHTVEVKTERPFTLPEFIDRLSVRSLADTWRELSK